MVVSAVGSPPQGLPRAPSSDEECFFDLLSKFQGSRMDDQRCPLEEGQPRAAEATAAAALEERIGERPRRAPLGLEGSGAPGALAPKGGGHQLQSAPRHRELPAPASPGAASWGTCHLARPPERGVRLVSLGVGVGGQALLPSPPGGRAGTAGSP